MNRLIPLVVRALSLIAATGITGLIISIHAADNSTLGAHDTAVSRAPAIVNIDTTGAQPAARTALAASTTR